MSTLKATNLQHASATSPNITLGSDGSVAVGGGNISPQTGFKNRIINGDMRIDQRNNGATVTPTASAYTLDRWQLQCTQSSKLSVQQVLSMGPQGSNYVALASLSSYSVNAGDFFAYAQKIEGFNTADLQWGTGAAKTITLSFWVNCSLSGTFGGAITNANGTRSYPFTYTISSPATWEYKTITVPGDTTGTWAGAVNTTGLILYFGLGAGSTYSGTANAWAAANYVSATGATSVVGTNGAILYITGVQLEKGSVATPFEFRSIGQELALCQRYFQSIPTINWNPVAYAGGTPITHFSYKVTMRTSASVTLGTPGGGSGSWTADVGTAEGCRIYAAATTTIAQYTNSSVSAEL